MSNSEIAKRKKLEGNYKKAMLIAIIALVSIFGMITLLAYGNDKTKDQGSNSNTSQQKLNSSEVDKNSVDYNMYDQLKGDDYDRMFIANMIAHHEGAVDMAKVALTSAKYQEIKDLANNILATQTKEINDMQNWQKAWGYPSSSGEMMMDHSAMGMMHEMDEMSEKLEGLSGDEFDKEFIASMIVHHQAAVNMAYPGQTNAKHQELKALTIAIVNSQSKEIEQMKQWQKDWGYLSE